MTKETAQKTAANPAGDSSPKSKTKAERKRASAKKLAGILDSINEHLKGLLVLEDGYPPELILLWACHARAFAAATHNPPLMVTADTFGAGKTEAASVTSLLVKNPVPLTNPTAAIIYRNTGKAAPGSKTMMIDEADQGVFDSKDMTAVINSAWSPEFAQVQRCVEKKTRKGVDYVPEAYSLWQPFVFSMIGMPFKGSTRSRCIVVKMKQIDANSPEYENMLKGKDRTEAKGHLKKLGDDLGMVLAQHTDDLLVAEPEYPVEVASLRQRDNIRLMLAVADLAGDHWPETARQVLCAGSDASLQVSELCEDALQVALDWIHKQEDNGDYVDSITGSKWVEQGIWNHLWGDWMTQQKLRNVVSPLTTTRIHKRAGGRVYLKKDIETLLHQIRAGLSGKDK